MRGKRYVLLRRCVARIQLVCLLLDPHLAPTSAVLLASIEEKLQSAWRKESGFDQDCIYSIYLRAITKVDITIRYDQLTAEETTLSSGVLCIPQERNQSLCLVPILHTSVHTSWQLRTHLAANLFLLDP